MAVEGYDQQNAAEWSIGGEPKRSTEVPTLLDRLDKEIAVIGESVARLRPSLESVLGQDTPHALGSDVAETTASPLGSRLQSMADKIAGTNRALLNILGRIEV